MKSSITLMLSLLTTGAVLCSNQLLKPINASQSTDFSFALIGDLPYTTSGIAPFQNVIRSINTDRSVRFVMHAGDIKAGSERCDDALIKARFDEFQKFRTAFIFTPGDNEWTDCHRTSNGSYNPLERLDFLRRLFFPNPSLTTGQRPIRVIPQGAVQPNFNKFVENVFFIRNRVIFATLHVVGSNNNLAPWSGIDPADSFATPRPDRLAEFKEREQATLAWLDYIFSKAQTDRASGVFLLMQANPSIELPETDERRAGFNQFLKKLVSLAQQYGKPVVLAHGDDHVFIIDKPFYTYASAPVSLPYMTRVQTFGDNRSQWLKVRVDPNASPVFAFEEKIVNP